MTSRPGFSLHRFENGTATLRDESNGQLMHSQIGPADEAALIYLGQTDLAVRTAPGVGNAVGCDSPLVVWDVGLGLAANAIALIRAYRALGGDRRHLRVVSFESDVRGLSSGLDIAGTAALTHLDGPEPSRPDLRALIERGSWHSADGAVEWNLLNGDFEAQLDAAPAPEVVYYDFYSPRVMPDLWRPALFARVRQRMAEANASAGTGPVLITYSAATPVRLGLLVAGFYVGDGAATAAKRQTTVAALHSASLLNPLRAEWLAKLDRSSRPAPYGEPWPPAAVPAGEWAARARAHPQFTSP